MAFPPGEAPVLQVQGVHGARSSPVAAKPRQGFMGCRRSLPMLQPRETAANCGFAAAAHRGPHHRARSWGDAESSRRGGRSWLASRPATVSEVWRSRSRATTMRRFWTMVAHYHGERWNAAEVGRSLGVSGPTVRCYLDTLTEALVVRQLVPWFENVVIYPSERPFPLHERVEALGFLPAMERGSNDGCYSWTSVSNGS